MGCIFSEQASTIPLEPIKDPKGPMKDPMEAEGNIVQAIVNDSHIEFFQKKIEQVLIPINRGKRAMRNISQLQKFATADKKQHTKYIDSINEALNSNAVSTTNVLSIMFQEMADVRDLNNAQAKFKHDQQYAALKCFIYLYTGNYAYKKINSSLRKNQYDKISKVIGVVQKQLEEYNKQQFARKLKANPTSGRILDLYRGIPKPDKSMSRGAKMFWKGFTSTSLKKAVANNFGKYQFIITLDNTSPHAYMIVPEGLSQFQEEEIIIFPYFYFECVDVQDFGNGAKYTIKQTAPQN